MDLSDNFFLDNSHQPIPPQKSAKAANGIERPLRRFNLPIDICPKYFAQFYFAHLDICSNEICSKWRRHLPMKTLAQFHASNYLCLALTFNYLLNGNTVGMVLHKQLQNISITGFSYDLYLLNYDLPRNPWIFQPKSMLVYNLYLDRWVIKSSVLLYSDAVN